ncbi:MAG: S-adenosylmethionine synthetase [Candidatus Tectimicrobiota bacterium]|nr:MAG: S-adenosylmethionine synthetase [Candidatus Tectomicrobia bacterium]
MSRLILEHLPGVPVSQQRLELVERKGLGHPDTLCDALMEAVSVALCQAYLAAAGRVLHYNLDKGLLVAGQTTPALGGGRVEVPMRLIVGDRATLAWQGEPLPVAELVAETVRRWIGEHLRFVDPQHHLVLQNELRPGSPELVDLFARQPLGANDTSAAVGYAPLTETERCVLAAERYLNSPAFKARFPETGEDVKIMGCRQERHLSLTVALAFVDRFIPDERTYFERKAAVAEALQRYLEGELRQLESVSVHLNTLDAPGRGLGGMYLTVLGTSAESGDGGQVGRGNRVNGVISLNRPAGSESAAGKNPVSHVGKIYSLLAHHLAERLYEALEPVEEVYVWLCSQIGAPIDRPWVTSVQVRLAPGTGLYEVERPITDLVEAELANMPAFIERLVHGAIPVW